ncbi:MAG: lysophospholipid acyltransferase family protein [Oscillospiraceae bacterium]
MRTIIWFIYFWFYLLKMIPKLKVADRLLAEGKMQEHRDLVKNEVNKWANSLLKLAGADVTITGKENIPDEPVIFVSNHQGNFDVPLLLAHLDTAHSLLAKVELKKVPFINRWMEHLKCIFVDRQNPRQSVAAMNEAADLLKSGQSVIIFPEGTRSRGETIGEFKSGSFKIAEKAKVPIVPIVMDGSYKLMENNKNFIRPAKVKIKILPPIKISELSKQEIRQLPEQIRELIVEEKSKA